GLVVDGGSEVVAAGNQIELVFDGPSPGQGFIPAPDRHEDYFGAASRQLTGHFGEMQVPADHHADPAEVGVENGVVLARRDAAVDLLARQADLAILAEQLAVPANQDADVV